MSTIDESKSRYEKAMHGVQTGIEYASARGWRGVRPKRLRLGVDSAHVTNVALARLMIAKGIITEDEYFEAVAVVAEEERASWEMLLSEEFGIMVSLG